MSYFLAVCNIPKTSDFFKYWDIHNKGLKEKKTGSDTNSFYLKAFNEFKENFDFYGYFSKKIAELNAAKDGDESSFLSSILKDGESSVAYSSAIFGGGKDDFVLYRMFEYLSSDKMFNNENNKTEAVIAEATLNDIKNAIDDLKKSIKSLSVPGSVSGTVFDIEKLIESIKPNVDLKILDILVKKINDIIVELKDVTAADEKLKKELENARGAVEAAKKEAEEEAAKKKDEVEEGKKDEVEEGKKDKVEEGKKDKVEEGKKDEVEEGKKDEGEGRDDADKGDLGGECAYTVDLLIMAAKLHYQFFKYMYLSAMNGSEPSDSSFIKKIRHAIVDENFNLNKAVAEFNSKMLSDTLIEDEETHYLSYFGCYKYLKNAIGFSDAFDFKKDYKREYFYKVVQIEGTDGKSYDISAKDDEDNMCNLMKSVSKSDLAAVYHAIHDYVKKNNNRQFVGRVKAPEEDIERKPVDIYSLTRRDSDRSFSRPDSFRNFAVNRFVNARSINNTDLANGIRISSIVGGCNMTGGADADSVYMDIYKNLVARLRVKGAKLNSKDADKIETYIKSIADQQKKIDEVLTKMRDYVNNPYTEPSAKNISFDEIVSNLNTCTTNKTIAVNKFLKGLDKINAVIYKLFRD